MSSTTPPADVTIDDISAVTLSVRDMAISVAFYEALGFRRITGGPEADFTSFRMRTSFLNLIAARDASQPAGDSDGRADWGRVIIYVSDVDGMYARATAAGFAPDFAPRDAPWDERYFHIADPDGHEVSFAKPL